MPSFSLVSVWRLSCRLSSLSCIDRLSPVPRFVAGVAMDPSQGNTSGLVMTNHLYRFFIGFIFDHLEMLIPVPVPLKMTS